ncbi:MAG: TetR/AcrR family transcriptional regulator [Roseinatronobacter sp.]
MARVPRDELRARLIDSAEQTIRARGLDALRARDLARDAGCAVGAIYNVFADLDQLVLAVNGRTFKALGAFMRMRLAPISATDPEARLHALAQGYRDFARDNRNAWLALFDLQIGHQDDVPNWYWQEMSELFDLIAEPLAELRPQDSPEARDLLVRTLFSAVHGIVLVGVVKRLSGVPEARIEEMLSLTIRQMIRSD